MSDSGQTPKYPSEEKRKAFELWRGANGGMDMPRMPNGDYRYREDEQCWLAWEAAGDWQRSQFNVAAIINDGDGEIQSWDKDFIPDGWSPLYASAIRSGGSGD